MKKIDWNEAPHDAEFYAAGAFRKENPFGGENCQKWTTTYGWLNDGYPRKKLENFDDYQERPSSLGYVESWAVSHYVDNAEIEIAFVKGDVVYFNFSQEPSQSVAPPAMHDQKWSYTSIKSVHRKHVRIVKKAWVKLDGNVIVERHTAKPDDSYIEIKLTEKLIEKLTDD